MINKLNQFLADLRVLRRDIAAESSKTISKRSLRQKAERLSTEWLSDISVSLEIGGHVAPAKLKEYSDHFRQLLRITGPSNLKTRYLAILSQVTRSFRNDIILVLHECASSSPSLSLLSTLFEGLPADEDAYLKEAVGCAMKGYLRASVVLGWSAAIDRIQRRIEDIGFAKFNVTSAQMSSEQKGRFKRFNQVQNVSSLSELREVFDNIVLWVIEGMCLIDSNQHTRLHSCFDMRCQSAHPGDAPITEFNLISFYSDLKEIVFTNPSFQLNSQSINPRNAPTKA
ncbi:MAG TPA: hypothetical protein PLI09_09950 [Candidatus Hydrogenedentes bacterium]|nr:hypothetical protein [Candidatus Hydrogenedentota bacterium]